MKYLLAAVAGIAALALSAFEMIGFGYYLSWVDRMQDYNIRGGFFFAGLITLMAVCGATLFFGAGAVAVISDADQ